MSSRQFLIFGIDGGGTGCRAAVCDSGGKRLGEGKAGPANIMTDLAAARRNIVEACLKALAAANLPEADLANAAALVGVAGANVGSYARDAVASLPFRKCAVETDAVIALQGALGDSDGIVAIIGTGSVFISRHSGNVRTVGGWGFLVGDLGSGARLGRDLLEEALLAHDNIREHSPITLHILDRFGNDPRSIAEYASAAKPGDFGSLAPLILDYAGTGDMTAKRIWLRSVAAVEETLASMVTDEDDRICMLGGLGPRFGEFLSDRLVRMTKPPLGTALDGAVTMALQRFGRDGN